MIVPVWQFEVKWDGIRALAYVETGQLRLFSRNNRDLTDHFPELHRLPRSLKGDRAVLDGEIVALNRDGKPSFLRLQKRIHLADSIQVHQVQALVPLVFILFDILWWQSEDVTILPLAVRGELLQEGLRWEAPFVRSPVTKGTGGRLYSPFALSPSIPGIVRWVSPALVCRIQYRGWTIDKKLRQPVFRELRYDKVAQECSTDAIPL